jgi:hypothetical protein
MSDIVENLRQGKAGYQSYSAFVQVTPTHLEAANEIERLQAENARLREALKECADDLEAEITHRYGEMVPKYPRERLKRDKDMAPVLKARALLGETQ